MVGNGDDDGESTPELEGSDTGSDADHREGHESAVTPAGTEPGAGAENGEGLLDPRTRIVIGDRFGPLLGLLLVLVLTGGLLTYATHVEPGTHVERRTVSTWETTADWEHGAQVTQSNPVFARGTTLSDRSVYFTAVSPRLEGSFSYGYTASGSGNLSVDLTTTLVLRSVGERNGQEVVYWRVSEPLGRPRSTSLAPGETARGPFTTNVSGIQQRIQRIEDDLGGSPGETEARILTRVRATGTVNGRSVRRFDEYSATVELDDGTYRVTDTEMERRRQNTTREVTVTNSYGPLRRVGIPLLFLVGAVGVAGLVVGRAEGYLDVPPAVRERLAFEAERREFDDWITTGSIDIEVEAGSHVEVDSLEGLVDVAIDTDNRVLEDVDTERFLVLADSTVYRFDAPTDPRETASSVVEAETSAPVPGEIEGRKPDGTPASGDGEAHSDEDDDPWKDI